MTTNELGRKLRLKTLSSGDDKEISSCYISDLLSRVMGSCKDGDVWITVQTSLNMVAVALMIDVACVVFPEGLVAPDDVIEKAKEEGLTLFSSDETAFGLAKKLAEIFD